MHKSETSKVRDRVAHYCEGAGIDVGFGGDPIVPSAICIDIDGPFPATGQAPRHLGAPFCAAYRLPWFADESIDYVYSSHLIEDFADTAAVLREWYRVLKPFGRMIVVGPVEELYQADCEERGTRANSHHIFADFGQDYVLPVLEESLGMEIVYREWPVGVYSFVVVAEKSYIK